MSVLNRINNNFILNYIFSFTRKNTKLKLLKYNKDLQKRLDISLFDFQKNIFYDTPKIELDNLLPYYDYLKRAFKDDYSVEILKNYYVEFFCRYLKENDILFELDSTHELVTDILLCEKLEKIKIVINIEEFKSSIIDRTRYDKNKKQFIKLFRIIFNNPKIVQFIILENDKIPQKNNYINKITNDLSISTMFYQNLLENLVYDFPSIKTNSLLLIDDLYNRELEKNKNKLIELIIPANSVNSERSYDYLTKIPIKYIHQNNAFDISNLFQIHKFGLKNVHLKMLINEENSKKLFDMHIKINFRNIKKLELIFDDNSDIYFSKSSNIINLYREKAFYEGKLLMNQLFYQNNYLKHIYDLYIKNYLGYKIYFKLLEELEKCKFEYLYIGKEDDSVFYYINKITNSIGFFLFVTHYNEQFLQKLSNYEDVKIRSLTKKNINNDDNNYNQEIKSIKIFKYDPNSKVKHFSFRHRLNLFAHSFLENFPLNFNNLISLELGFNICYGCNLIFPLFEDKCDFSFINLKKLLIYLDVHCTKCLSFFNLDIFKNLGQNLQFCKNLEIFSISVNEIKSNIKDIMHILNGLKVLEYLREFSLLYSDEEYNEIDENKFYKFYPQYVKLRPFLNKIKIVISDFAEADLLYEKKIDYRENDIIIKDYRYIGTLGDTKSESYTTYLCINKNGNKVVIRKFKKSRIKAAQECFENEKYCLKKFKQNPKVINYIEFLEDENYKYIIYEYVPNSRKYFRSKITARAVIISLYENFYKNALIDKNILLYPISYSDILITNNFEILIIGFGYLNLYVNNKYDRWKQLTNYYNVYNEYNYGFYLFHYLSAFNEYYSNDLNEEFQPNNFYHKKDNETNNKIDSLINILKQKNDEYFQYKNSLKKYLPKFTIEKEIKFESKCNEGKIYFKNSLIFILKSQSIEIYKEFNYNLENTILVKEEDENPLKTLLILENNILICTDENTIYVISFEKNNNKIIKTYNISEIKNKINSDFLNNLEDNNIELFIELIKIRDTNYFISSGNFICLWNADKDLQFIKVYDNFTNCAIFEYDNNLANYIGFTSKKIIFFNILENYELKTYKEFNFNFNKLYRIRRFIQKDNSFFIIDNYQLTGFKADLEKGILINIFCHKFYGCNQYAFISFFNFKYGIIGTKGSTLTYLSFKKKKNRKYKGIDIYLIPGNDTLYDFNSYNNKLFILEGAKLLIINN